MLAALSAAAAVAAVVLGVFHLAFCGYFFDRFSHSIDKINVRCFSTLSRLVLGGFPEKLPISLRLSDELKYRVAGTQQERRRECGWSGAGLSRRRWAAI